MEIKLMTNLVQEFEKTAEEINTRLKIAAVALREANKLANAAGLPSLIYAQWTGDQDDSLDALSKDERNLLENDEDWDGESSPLKMKIDMIDVSALEDEISVAGWSTSSSYC
jgi:hypothetical protein